jgi:hypothetical protein
MNHPEKKVRPGFYVAQKLSSGISYAEAVNSENTPWFAERMVQLMEEILNPEIPFERTSDLKRCEYCPYKDHCHR